MLVTVRAAVQLTALLLAVPLLATAPSPHSGPGVGANPCLGLQCALIPSVVSAAAVAGEVLGWHARDSGVCWGEALDAGRG